MKKKKKIKLQNSATFLIKYAAASKAQFWNWELDNYCWLVHPPTVN